MDGNEQLVKSKEGLEDWLRPLEPIKDVSDLVAWQEARKLAKEIYVFTASFPEEERFGLVSQMRRSAVSVVSNIAEGFGRFSAKDKCRFYEVANGSLLELQTQCIVSRDVGFSEQDKVEVLNERMLSVRKLLLGLIKSTRSNF